MSTRPRQVGNRLLEMALGVLPASLRERMTTRLVADCPDDQLFRLGIRTLRGELMHLRRNGFEPTTIVDIGAYVGDWSRSAAGVFPQADYVLIDANPQNREALDRAVRELGPRSRFEIALLGADDGTAEFYQAKTGSSVLRELTSFPVGPPVRLPMRTLDSVLRDLPRRRPLLLKLDVQGFELEVLRGGPGALADAEVIVLETALLPYNEGAPLFAEVIAFMAGADFAVYDFFGEYRRQSDGALFQADIVFARVTSALRRPAKFWLAEP